MNFPLSWPVEKEQSKSIPNYWQLLDIAAADNSNQQRKEVYAMINNYEVPEVVEMGKAQDVILGQGKLLPIVPESPGQPDRDVDMNDDE